MADKQISQLLPKPTPVASTDQFGIDDNVAVAYKITVANLQTYFNSVYVPLAGGTMTGQLILNANPLTSLAAATKQYVDSQVVSGGSNRVSWVGTTSDLGAVYNNGVAGFGRTLVNNGVQTALVIDGVALSVGKRVLVKDQTNTFENGLYVVTTIGTGVTNWVLTGDTLADTADEILPGSEITVAYGTINSLTQWLQTTSVVTVGTDPILYQYNIIAGIGLTRTNNTLNVIGPGASGNVFVSNGTNWTSATITNITAVGAQVQALNMNSHLINNLTDPVSSQDAATKNYVDSTALNGTSVYAATTTNLTVTQSGAGVGATLTNAGAQATFSLDGTNPPVGTNVLVKNLAAAANEGIYTVTDVGSGSSNWVLTRASSYDTATEINNTGLILIRNGSTLVGTAWYNAATIVTVDTTSFSYSQFGNIVFPVPLASGGTSASLVASNGGIFYSTASAGAILAGVATAGKMLQSGATAPPTWSTPTYPSASGTAGKMLRADGTNNVYSTSTFADTYAASVLLYSNGANTVTGLATANNGVLVTSNTGVPSILAGPGTTGLSLLSQASAPPIWSTGKVITQVVRQVFINSGTYTPTAGMTFCDAEAVGGGGGGGGAGTSAGSQASVGGAGGGAGYARKIFTAATIGASQVVTVGAAGTAGAAAAGTGGTGGTSSLGGLLVATGGGGGPGAIGSALLATNGGAPGTGSGGDFNTAGAPGGGSFNSALLVYAGNGGSSFFGGGANGLFTIGAGNAANSYGGGGGGGVTANSAQQAGGAGFKGLVIVTEYINV